MFSKSAAINLCIIYNGALIQNDFCITPDFKRLFVYHTSNVNISSTLHSFLYVTFSIEAARRQWNARCTRRGHQDLVNVFTVPIDYDCHFARGDKFEKVNGGRGIILDTSNLEFVGHVTKDCLEDFVRKENHAISSGDYIFPDVAKLVFQLDIEQPETLYRCLHIYLNSEY